MIDFDKYLKILGLESGANREQIREAYRDLVKVWHPDRFEHDSRLKQKAQERLKEINEAFEQLKHYRPEPHTTSQARSSPSGTRPAGASRPPDPGSSPDSGPSSDASGQEPNLRPPTNSVPKKRPARAWLVVAGLFLIFVVLRAQFENPSPSKPRVDTFPLAPVDRQVPEPKVIRPPAQPQTARRSSGESAAPEGKASSGIPSHTDPSIRPPTDQTGGIGGGKSARFHSSPPTTGAEIQRIPPSTPIKDTTHITVGSTWDEVLKIQGTPDRFTQDSLHYGTSDIFFRNKKVVGWYNGYPKLKISLLPSRHIPNLSHFTRGSTWDEVLAVQGTPDRFTNNSLHYGTSDVHFQNGHVVNWYNGYPRLKVQLTPKQSVAKEYFTVGSTVDDVLAVQGTPDRMSQDALHYGTSDVFFKDGRVVNWYNGYPKLKVRLEPGG